MYFYPLPIMVPIPALCKLESLYQKHYGLHCGSGLYEAALHAHLRRFGFLRQCRSIMLSLWQILLILPAVALASTSAECASACQSPLSDLLFTGSKPSADYYALTCTNVLLVQSTFLCMRFYCSENEIAGGLASLDSTCLTYGFVNILPWSIISNITDEELLASPHIDVSNLYNPVPYETPVFISASLFEVSLKTMVL